MAKGMKTKADMDNHANQLNPNNWRYQKVRKHHTEKSKKYDDDFDEWEDEDHWDDELERELDEEARLEINWTIHDWIDYYGGWQDDW